MLEFKKKIGLALGGGGARGIAHIGILKFFEEQNIKINYLSGTSMGALIGALYASGKTPDELAEIAKEFTLKDQIRLIDVGLPHGLLKGKKIIKFLEKYIPEDLTFEDLVLPLSVTAVDLMSGELKVLTQGSVIEAVRASISYPFFFQPVVKNKEILVDGGLLLNIPIKPLWNMGANFIVAARVSHFFEFEEQDNILKSNFFDTPVFVKILLRSLAVTTKTIERNYLRIHEPDVIIDVYAKEVNPTNFVGAKHLIDKGYSAARAAYKNIIKKKLFYSRKKRGVAFFPTPRDEKE